MANEEKKREVAKEQTRELILRDGNKYTFAQTLYVSNAEKAKLQDGLSSDEISALNEAHTFQIELDFTGVTLEELIQWHCSQTTFRKKVYNDHIRPNVVPDENGKTIWNDAKIVEMAKVKGPALKFNVREMLDTSRTRPADPAAKAKRGAKDMVKAVAEGKMSKEDAQALLAELQKQLA